MRKELEGVLHLVEPPSPSCLVGDHFNVAGLERNKIQFAHGETVFQQPQFLPVEAHQSCGHAIDRARMRAGQNHAARLGVGRHRTAALAANDAVHDREIAERLGAPLAAAVEREKAFVQVQHHAPAGVIAVPVAGAHHFLRIPEDQSPDLFPPVLVNNRTAEFPR